VINHAAAIAFLVAGSSKAAVVTKIFSSPNCRLPAARVAAVDGQLTWFMTADAAVT
jgi:6-phosphogluconolactonase/glucosamine-6-phosphate isomerase/deaminase